MKIIDLHCDVLSLQQRMFRLGKEYCFQKNTHHIDLEKMRKGDYLLQCFAVFANPDIYPDTYSKALEEIISFHSLMNQYSDKISAVTTYQDIVNNQKLGKISALLTIEDAGFCKGKLEELDKLHQLGVRMMSLTWNYENKFAAPNIVPEETEKKSQCLLETEHGLKPLGFEFLYEMERLGIIVDVSHLSDAGFRDIAHAAKRPFIASHSNARTISGHVRNLSDDMLREIADHGGLVGINYCPIFLDPAEKNSLCCSSVEWIVQHICHIRKIAGIDVLAFGSDFEGFCEPSEIQDCSKVQLIADALSAAGFHSSEIEQIFCRNALRLFRDCI